MFGLGLNRFGPAPLRPAFARGASRVHAVTIACRLALDRQHQPDPVLPDGPITVIGLLSSATGIGQGARLMWRDLEQRGVPVVAVDVTKELTGSGGPKPEGALDAAALLAAEPGTIVMHLNPPLYATMYLRLPRHLRRHSHVVAYWAWEMERIPRAWLIDARAADEIWVPSEFVAHAVRRGLGPEARKPVKIVPHPVHALPPAPRKTPERTAEIRARHGLPRDAFIVGYSFAMGSNFARKNPIGVVTAFRDAFRAGDRAALLVLRCSDLELWPQGAAELARAIRDDPRIALIDQQTRHMPIAELYETIDVYLSLHRSEGYGLNLAEAASVGTPVLATGWGLATDILARPEVCPVGWTLVPVDDPQRVYGQAGARWAEPDLGDAVAKLRALSDRTTPAGT
jgi:glycosyltransferase involved in cell wall biosynthesis